MMHISTFEYLQPTSEQLEAMAEARAAFADFAAKLDPLIPEGPDKTYILRRLREVAMWVNVAISRHPDGTPRS